jgi:Spy/CpxP family protein refolding chaperone
LAGRIKMTRKKKIFVFAAGVIAGLAITLVAAVTASGGVSELRAEGRRLLAKVLTPGQIKTLLDFRSEMIAEHKDMMDMERPSPLEVYDNLSLSAEQEDALVGIAEANIDEINVHMETVFSAWVDLREAAMTDGVSRNELREASKSLAGAIGEGALLAKDMVNQGRVILTEEQIGYLGELHKIKEERELMAFERGPKNAERVLKLWKNLDLTPEQIGGFIDLGQTGSDVFRKHRKDREEKAGERMATFLDDRQMEIFKDHHEKHKAEHKAMHLRRLDRAEELWTDMDPTKEQMDAITAIFEANLDDMVAAGRGIHIAGAAVREAVLDPDSDEGDIMDSVQVLAEAITDAAVLSADMIAEAKLVGTPEQVKIIEVAILDHEGVVIEHIAKFPHHASGLIELREQLNLSQEQKREFVKMIDDHHKKRMERMRGIH